MKKIGVMNGVAVWSDPNIPDGIAYMLNYDAKWKFKVLNRKRYKGRGRPKMSDYDFKEHIYNPWDLSI